MSDKCETSLKAFKVLKGSGLAVVISTAFLLATLVYCAEARKPASEFASRFDPTLGTTANPGRWHRPSWNPIFRPGGPAWRSRWTANPDLLKHGEEYFLYYRGNNGTFDQIGVATVPANRFDGRTWNDFEGNPVVKSGGNNSYDYNALDPATVEVKGLIYLYYSACGNGPDRIGLAVSRDGFHFRKPPESPILIGRAPEVVYRDGIFYLYYVVNRGRGYEVHLAISPDGIHFTPRAEPILTPGSQPAWDSQSVTTPRIFEEDSVYNMVYAGCKDSVDEPRYFGLATSSDLVHWSKFSGNPIFGVGPKGAWDGGCIWFGTTEKIGGKYYLWYEGSRGHYSTEVTSQVGMATLRPQNERAGQHCDSSRFLRPSAMGSKRNIPTGIIRTGANPLVFSTSNTLSHHSLKSRAASKMARTFSSGVP